MAGRSLPAIKPPATHLPATSRPAVGSLPADSLSTPTPASIREAVGRSVCSSERDPASLKKRIVTFGVVARKRRFQNFQYKASVRHFWFREKK
jgi:hypothetical protein